MNEISRLLVWAVLWAVCVDLLFELCCVYIVVYHRCLVKIFEETSRHVRPTDPFKCYYRAIGIYWAIVHVPSQGGRAKGPIGNEGP